MAIIYSTPTQKRFLEPYKQRVFQYDSEYSNIYLSRYTNNLLNVIGDDCILRDADIINLNKINGDTGIEFTVESGDIIHDLTFIQLKTNTTIQFPNLNIYSSILKVIVYTSFQYIQSTEENELKIKTSLYDPVNHVVLDGWEPTTDRIILGVIGFTITDNLIDLLYLEDWANININGVNYSIRKTPQKVVLIDGGIL